MDKKKVEKIVREYLLKLLLKDCNIAEDFKEDIENLPDEYKQKNDKDVLKRIEELSKDAGFVPISIPKSP